MDKQRLDKRILITGGGSGGHISAALSIIGSLQEKYLFDDEHFLYVGGDLGMEGEKPGNSMEQKLMKDKDFNCKYIRPGKLQRTFSFNTIKLIFRKIL
jgi:UDP-N-acetylglucosamine:LPS N-acetylglucosamine transferase